MKGFIRRQIQNTLACPPVLSAIQGVRHPNAISIFGYNGLINRPLPVSDWCFIDTEAFRQQIAYLSKTFELISLPEALNLMSHKKLRGRKAVITFDDGFQSVKDIALPILQEYSAPATIYLTGELADKARSAWFTRIILALSHTRVQEVRWQGNAYPLASAEQKSRLSQLIQHHLQQVTDVQIQAALSAFETSLKVEVNPEIEAGSPFKILDRATISAMNNHPLITWGAHLRSHEVLSKLADSEKNDQIKHAISAVKDLTGGDCRHFAYPGGRLQASDNSSPRLLTEAGVISSVTMNPGPVTTDTPLLHLNRYSVGASTTFSRFKLMAHHIGR
ncbi:MAG: polysaccharide deacetylase family protein [Pontibacterium sp.]